MKKGSESDMITADYVKRSAYGQDGGEPKMNRIPLTVVVTGHIDLREHDRDALYNAVKRELEQLQVRYPHTPVWMINSLAAGADLLCAEAGEALGIPMIAALPMPEEEYRKDFAAADLVRLEHQLQRAETVIVTSASEKEPAEITREFLYRQAGIYMAEHSHLVLALWDGAEQREKHAGTAATVRFALEGDWNPERGLPVSNGDNTGVIHILTPRGEAGPDRAGTVRRLGCMDALEADLDKTEEFNRLAMKTDLPGGTELLPPEEAQSPEMRKMAALYQTADGLSMRYARLNRRILAGLALSGTALTMAFLMYDDAELKPLILLCGVALCAALMLFRMAGRTACHRRFVEYRALAEALRVQLFLRYAGSGLQVQRLMTWTQKQETTWVMCALCAINTMPPPERKQNILECWVKGQQEYYRSANKRAEKRLKKQNRTLMTGMIISISAYVILLVYELVYGGLLLKPVFYLKDPEIMRTLMKIVLGTVSAGTLFMAGYYGKMSLSRVIGDFQKMEAFYEKAADRIIRRGESEQILETLAREELTENGNWSSYQRDNAPEINV